MAWHKFSELISKSSAPRRDLYNLKRDELSFILGVNTKTINEFQAKGLKSNTVGKRAATYDLSVVAKFLMEQRKARAMGVGNDTSSLKTQIMGLDKELKDIKLQTQLKSLVNLDDVNSQFQTAGNALRERLERISLNYPDVSKALANAIEDTITELGIGE